MSMLKSLFSTLRGLIDFGARAPDLMPTEFRTEECECCACGNVYFAIEIAAFRGKNVAYRRVITNGQKRSLHIVVLGYVESDTYLSSSGAKVVKARRLYDAERDDFTRYLRCFGQRAPIVYA
jgi:hypothetical protein